MLHFNAQNNKGQSPQYCLFGTKVSVRSKVVRAQACSLTVISLKFRLLNPEWDMQRVRNTKKSMLSRQWYIPYACRVKSLLELHPS